MGLDRAAVDHVARLARLALGEEERNLMQAELTGILEHAEKIQALDLDDVEATFHAVRMENAFRPDEVRPGLTQEEALRNAPEAERGRFKVPRIIEDEGE